MNLKLIAQHLVPALRHSLRAPGLCLIGLEGGRTAADEEQHAMHINMARRAPMIGRGSYRRPRGSRVGAASPRKRSTWL